MMCKTGRGILLITMSLVTGFLMHPRGFGGEMISPGDAPPSSKRPFTVDDALSLDVLKFSSEYGISRDGEWLAYEVKNGYQTNAKIETPYSYVPRGFYVFVKALGGGKPFQITHGEEYSWTPSWSPDGRTLAFYVWHNDNICIGLWDRKSRFIEYVEAASLNGKGSLDWSPQSHRVYYFPSDIKIYGPVLPYEETEKVIIRTTGEKDSYEERFTDVRKSQLWVLDLKTRKTSSVISEETSFHTHSLSPDGQKMAVSVLVRNPVLTHLVPSYARLDLLPTGGGQIKTVFNDKLYTILYTWAPDGRSIAYLDDGKLMVYDVGGDKTTSLNGDDVRLTGQPAWHPDAKHILCSASQDYYMFSVAGGGARRFKIDIPYSKQQYLWDKKGGLLYIKVLEEMTGRQGLYRLDWKQGKVEEIFFGESMISQLAWLNGRLFFTLQNKITPENIWMLDPRTKKKTQLTDTNGKAGDFALGRSELIQWKGLSGDPLKGVLIYPGDYIKAQKYPVVLWVYESFSQDLHRFLSQIYNLQVLANQGYAVLMPDIKFFMGDTARSFRESVVPALDRLIEMGIANGNFGVMGWSFGGFATNILITQTTRFKAAVTSCGITDWVSKNSMQGDFWRRGDQIGQGRLGGNLWEVRDNFVRNSPVFHVDKVQTPILILHGTEDRNVPFSQAEEMYYSLRDLGKTATLVAYPGETHLGGDAEAWVIKDMWTRIVAWFDKFLK